jgi:hypothetical protein
MAVTIRPDWGPKTPAVYNRESKDPLRPDWAPQRGADGKFISKDAAAVRSQWESEGGFQANVARVQAAESAMLALSPSLQTHIAALPNDIALIAADHLRLSPGLGKDAGAKRFEQFLNALSPDQFETFKGWFHKLTEAEQDTILGVVTIK